MTLGSQRIWLELITILFAMSVYVSFRRIGMVPVKGPLLRTICVFKYIYLVPDTSAATKPMVHFYEILLHRLLLDAYKC